MNNSAFNSFNTIFNYFKSPAPITLNNTKEKSPSKFLNELCSFFAYFNKHLKNNQPDSKSAHETISRLLQIFSPITHKGIIANRLCKKLKKAILPSQSKGLPFTPKLHLPIIS